jgi:PAS domain S-box-containing protein
MQSQTTNSLPTAIPISDGENQVFRLLRRLFWTGAVAVLALAIAVIALYVARQHAERWVQHSREVGRIALEARVFATDRQTRIRGYLLTRDTLSFEAERRARVGLTAALDSLVGMTSDNREQNDRARALRAAAVRWDQHYAQPVLSAPRLTAGAPGASAAALRDRELAGRVLFNKFRQTSADFLSAEDALYVARLRRDHLVDALSLLIVLLSTTALAIILRWMHHRVDGQTSGLLNQQAQLEEQAVELEESTAEIEATNEELQEAAADLEIANDEMRASAIEADRARARAEKANDKLESMLDRMTDSVLELDAGWRVTYLNKSAAAVGGVTLEDGKGRTLWEVWPATVGSEFERQYRKAMVEQVPVTFTQRYNDPGTLDVWVEVNAYPSPQALTLLYREVSKQKHAEDIVARRDYQFSEAQRIARVGSWEYDVATSLNIWSEEMCRLLGQPLDAVASLDTFIAQVVEADRPRVKAAIDRALRESDSFSIECRIAWPNGSVRAVHARGVASRNENGQSARIVGTVQDVTERWQLQEQLQQSQKMEAVGQLAGGVAHDFNNVLTAIKSFSELVAIELPEDSPLRSDVKEITAAADRAAALTRHLLAFSRRQMLQPVVLDLNGVVDGVTKLLARLIGVEVHCETALAPDLGHVLADPMQLEQVVINLAVNARDAMPNGGTLTLETANVAVDQRHASRLSGVEAAEPGEYVVLTVSDTGEGMDPAVRARIFEPFFTTKETGKGTGLGLSTVYGIVRQSGGYVSVYSEVGRGTTFRIYLPRVADNIQVQAPKPVVAQTPNGKETILLVDDDDAVRAVATRILTRAGYAVLGAGSPKEAEAVWADHAGPIHLLMTDLMMPGMNGSELASRLLESRKDARVLYTSGYTNETVIRRGLIIPDKPFLAKPFTIDEVIRKVRDALAN